MGALSVGLEATGEGLALVRRRGGSRPRGPLRRDADSFTARPRSQASLGFLRELDPVYGKLQPSLFIKRADRFLRQLAACVSFPAVACRRRCSKANFCTSLGHPAPINGCEYGNGLTPTEFATRPNRGQTQNRLSL